MSVEYEAKLLLGVKSVDICKETLYNWLVGEDHQYDQHWEDIEEIELYEDAGLAYTSDYSGENLFVGFEIPPIDVLNMQSITSLKINSHHFNQMTGCTPMLTSCLNVF